MNDSTTANTNQQGPGDYNRTDPGSAAYYMGYPNGESYDDDEREIDLADMFASILRKWKLIVVLTLICCAVVGVVGSYNSWKSTQDAYSEQSLSSLTEYMTDSEIENVQQLFNRYLVIQEEISDSQEYIDRSVLMQMDPNQVSQLSVEYAVSGADQNVAESFGLFSLDLDDYTEMAAIMGDDYDPMYMYEVISIARESDDSASDYSIDIDRSGDASKGTVGSQHNTLFSLSVKANSEDQCREIAAIADAAIQEHYGKLLDAGVSLVLTQVDSVYTEQVDQELANTQQANIEKGSDFYAEYMDFENNTISQLSDEEKALFDFYVNRKDNKIERPHKMRYFAIGGLIGLALGLVLVIIHYLTKTGFHTEEDVMRETGLKNIGIVVEQDEPRGHLNRFFIEKARAIENRALPDIGEEEQIRSACARIISICRKSGVDSLYLVKGFSTKYGDEMAAKFQELIGNHVAKVVTGSPAFSAEDLKALEQTQAAIVLTSMQASKPYVIRTNLSACEDCGVAVLGNVVIKDE